MPGILHSDAEYTRQRPDHELAPKKLSAKKARMKSWKKGQKNVHEIHERIRKRPSLIDQQ
jgi:hypothetical protein